MKDSMEGVLKIFVPGPVAALSALHDLAVKAGELLTPSWADVRHEILLPSRTVAWECAGVGHTEAGEKDSRYIRRHASGSASEECVSAG
jgi:hypothetical protein